MGGAALTPSVAVKHAPVLFVGPEELDRAALRRIFGRLDWDMVLAGGCCEALDYMRRHPVPVVLSAPNLPDGDWKRLLQETQGLKIPPNVIVCSRTADDRLWSEVLNLGGYDVLPVPFEPSEVSRVAELASQAWYRHRR